MVAVALTPAELRPAPVIVVVDVLRATSSITQALASGYAQVLCFDTPRRALRHRRPDRLLAGERGCLPPRGFDEGNSPAAFVGRRRHDVGLATTNGTPLIARAAALGGRVLAGCLLNLDAVAAAVAGEQVLVACAGTDGGPAIEDTFFAGRLVERLGSASGDGARIARAVADAFAPADAVAAGRGAANLVAAGLAHDVASCARVSVLDCVPQITPASPGVAVARPLAVASDHRALAMSTRQSSP